MSKFATDIYSKVFTATLRIERAANQGPVGKDVTAQLRADARALSEDSVFRKAYAARQGAGAIWLDKMIKDAARPVGPSESPSDRELWGWLYAARMRNNATEGVLILDEVGKPPQDSLDGFLSIHTDTIQKRQKAGEA